MAATTLPLWGCAAVRNPDRRDQTTRAWDKDETTHHYAHSRTPTDETRGSNDTQGANDTQEIGGQ